MSRPLVLLFSNDFKNFCEKFNIEIIYCTVGDHRSNGLVERLVYTIKSKLLAMLFELPKPSLNSSIEKNYLEFENLLTTFNRLYPVRKTF